MPNGEKKGITVQIDIELHAEIRQYLEAHDMNMTEFVTLALEHELHPKIQMKEEKENMRTLAFQIPEDLFQKIKDYLRHNDMTQKAFVIGLIETELERDLAEREAIQKGVDEQRGVPSAEELENASEDENLGEIYDESGNPLEEVEEANELADIDVLAEENEELNDPEMHEGIEKLEEEGGFEDTETAGFSMGM